jgi:TRAP-type C4-dicarboxylate transport system substrate-binding protein
MGLKRFESFPKDIQEALVSAARDTQKFVYATAEKEDKELLQKLKDAGMEVNEPNKDAFIAASKPVYEEFGKEVKGGKELTDKAIQLGTGS